MSPDRKCLLFVGTLVFVVALSTEMQYNTTLTISSNSTATDCFSFDDDYNNSTKFVIKGTVSLCKRVQFSNRDSIALYGERGSKVDCHGTNGGLVFVNMSNVVLHGIQVTRCSMCINNTGLVFKTALYFVDSSNVTIIESAVMNANGIGATLMNVTGTVNISNTQFTMNRYSESDRQEGGGLHIELINVTADYTIGNCTFEGNNASRNNFNYGYSDEQSNRLTFARGGGVFIYVGEGKGSNVRVLNSMFKHNIAQWGGGLAAKIVSARNNTLYISNCTFCNNTSTDNGGGALCITFHCSENSSSLSWNFVNIDDCWFRNNSAAVGGGVIVISKTSCKSSTENRLEFHNCTWLQNMAKTSAAIDLTRRNRTGNLVPIFVRCKFFDNAVIETVRPIQDGQASQINAGLAAFMVLYFKVVFRESVVFENNIGTALLAISGTVSFSNISAKFVNNTGSNGGAVLLRYSIIQVLAHSHFVFNNNRASMKGGAIYSYNAGEHDVHDYLTHACFIDTDQDHKGNISFVFTSNSAGNYWRNNSMFVYPLWPCSFVCSNDSSIKQEILTVEEILSCIGDFQYSNEENETLPIAGPGERFEVLQTLPLRVYPGLEFSIPVDVKDALNGSVNSSLELWIKDSPANNNSYQHTSNKVAKLQGRSGTKSVLLLRSSDTHYIDLQMNFTFEHCPPGFTLTLDECTCICENQTFAAYQGTNCLDNKSSIHHGFWIGYINDDDNSSVTTPENLFSSLCPLYFCSNNESNRSPYYQLPRVSDSTTLDEFICGTERTGILCGECRENYSVNFHSPYYECKQNKHCEIGWILYIVSELLPLTIMYIIIIVFNIKLTSGAFNGFMFFAQIIETVGVSFVGSGGLHQSNVLYWFFVCYEFVYRSFNLDFFGVSWFSFCLWSRATTLDMIAMKYLTVTYAFALVISTVLVMRYCTRCCKLRHKSHVVHGLSAFLIFCYVQCAHTSFKLLIPTKIDGLCLKSSPYQGVFYSGNVSYFSKLHLVYAIPALACILTIVTIPPLLLLWYPAANMLLGKCGLSESRIMTKISFLNRLKPLLDSFQSCYKDNCRFFSGLYFLYRLFTLAAFALTKGLHQFYLVVEVQLLLMLACHSIAQPYREKWHNILDTLLFVDLALLNALSMFIHGQQDHQHISFKKGVLSARALQVTLAYLPLLYITVYIVVYCIRVLKQKFNKNEGYQLERFDDDFPARLSDENDNYTSFSDNA